MPENVETEKRTGFTSFCYGRRKYTVLAKAARYSLLDRAAPTNAVIAFAEVVLARSVFVDAGICRGEAMTCTSIVTTCRRAQA